MKQARAMQAMGQVVSSYYAPPLLRGVVNSGGMSFRASLVINSEVDMENLCTCRDAREWGKICHHVVAVGLHWLAAQQPAPAASPSPRPGAPPAAAPVARPTPARPVGHVVARDAQGKPAELSIILPPNLGEAFARGRVMVVLEARWAGGRCPLSALPRHSSYAFPPADNAVIDHLEKVAGGQTPAILQLEMPEFLRLAPVLAGHPGVTLGKNGPLTVSRDPLDPPLRATLEPNGEIVVALKNPLAGLVTAGGWALHQGSLRPFGLAGFAAGALQGPLRLTRDEVPRFLNEHWPRAVAAGKAEANFTPETFSLQPQPPRFLLELRGGLEQLSALLQCRYGTRVMTLGVSAASEAVWLPDPAVPTRYSTRDAAAEQAAVARLRRCGFTPPDGQGKLLLNGQHAVLQFFAAEFPRLQAEWTVTIEERLDRTCATQFERVEPRFEITSSGVQWFDLGVVFTSSGGQSLPPAEIQRLLLSGQGHTRLRNGKIALFDRASVEEFQEVLRDCAPRQQDQGYRIHQAQAAFLDSAIREHPAWKVQASADWRDRTARQTGAATLECPPLGDLDATLRAYQKQGVAWLRFLRENSFGGILADEMGLGKTLQALAFFRWIREQQPGGPPMLVVCPTSLVFNWAAEAAKFTPSLKVLALHGGDRHARFADIPRSDIVITSYALIRRDTAKYSGLEFDTVVLDEAQHIKNRETQNAQAVKLIRAPHRLVLTGTPLENSVQDIWSIFDFLMTGYLGTAQDFRERYELPITRDQDQAAQTRLSRRLRPFLLRRLKKEVAADLPARLEQVSFCELTPDQRAAYQQVIEASRKEILEATGEQGLARSRMMVLSALLRLRQICCDLRLLKIEGVKPATSSGKLELFGELLQEVIDGGHRVLVFSQFVSMLTLLKEHLAAQGVDFCYLDGSTTNRSAEVARFQETPAIPVFLISLKAGGVGLNLTGADTVIHFDPWWNPAVEDQATDRAHRIGQTRVVTSYKLITRDTVEEKILMLQARKREVIQATLGGEESFAASLSWAEIQELLA